MVWRVHLAEEELVVVDHDAGCPEPADVAERASVPERLQRVVVTGCVDHAVGGSSNRARRPDLGQLGPHVLGDIRIEDVEAMRRQWNPSSLRHQVAAACRAEKSAMPRRKDQPDDCG